ncbi:Zinc finger, PHD-finger [Dillenia turbinata]|uniref:Zinc finger, PHD-finger n=1 Tax=Dillenia turbinata TaxID=194707 RepID=A0AAN8ZDW9_9MAGN
MDKTSAEPIDRLESDSKDLDVPGGEKRPMIDGENGEIEASEVKRKARVCKNGARDMKRVAEIVLVLSAMGSVRGGRSPTDSEKELMAEARAKLVDICEAIAPKDIVSKDAIESVIEDLGLNNKAKDLRLGFRTPKMSINDKLLHTKRKMEESKAFAAHAAAYSSQRSQANLSQGAENRGVSPSSRAFPSDKLSSAPITGGVQPTSALIHLSPATSTTLSNHMPVNEVKPPIASSTLASSHSGKDSSAPPLPKVERAHFRLDGRFNGSPLAPQVHADSAGDHQKKVPTLSLLSQSASPVNVGLENNALDHNSAKVEGTSDGTVPQITPPATSNQTPRHFATHAPSNLPSIHQPLQGVNFVQASSISNNSNEIAKIVQRLLQPQLPERPTWTPPSRDYMNKAMTCQACKLTINEVENVLVCDACEKGFHLKCLQSYNQKGIPRSEWHCPKCLQLSNGKPLPPKYGRVMRNISAPKVSSNVSGVPTSSEKQGGIIDQKPNHQRMTANGSTDSQSPAGPVGGNNSSLAPEIKTSIVKEMQGNLPSSNVKIEDKPSSGICHPDSMKISSIGISSDSQHNHFQPMQKCPDPDVNSSDCHAQQISTPQEVDKRDQPNGAQDLSGQPQLHKVTVVPNDIENHLRETSGYNPRKRKQDHDDPVQANLVSTSGTQMGKNEHAGLPSASTCTVDWIGDISQIVDEKKYYQSCCINGVAMWEDSKTKSKWVMVNRCYFPGDLPEAVGCPCAPESNEVYESNHGSTLMAGLIRGPCKVLPPNAFEKESDRRAQLGTKENGGMRPIFLCKWFYDEPKGLFRPVFC